MKTPKEFSDNLHKRFISKEMLDSALFSLNKRAKNCRDSKQFYSNSNYYDSYINKETEYYLKKEKLLSLIEPIAIHKEIRIKKYSKKYYSSEDCYDEIQNEERCGSYYDKELRQYVDFKVVTETVTEESIYLYYVVTSHSFHSPIDSIPLKYKELPVIVIDNLETKGMNINKLVSMQFVDKLLALVDSGDYELEI